VSGSQTAHEHLQNAWRALERQWRTSCGLWHDSVRGDFERDFWQPLAEASLGTLVAMRRLEKVTTASRREERRYREL
jgi:hypothetical protein